MKREVMLLTQRWIGVLAVFGIACTNTALHTARSGPAVLRSANDSAFALVVSALLTDTTVTVRKEFAFVIDPRPLRADDVGVVDDRTFAPASSDEVQRRTDILRSLGATPGDASFPRGCGGTLAPSTPTEPTHQGCPAVFRRTVALGLFRMVDTSEAMPSVPARFRAVRAIVAGIAPSGITAEIRDYYLGNSTGSWRIVKMKLLGYFE